MTRPRGSGTYPTRAALLASVARAAQQSWLRDRVPPTLPEVALRVGYRPRGLESALRREGISWSEVKGAALRWHSGGFWRDSAA